MAVTQSTIACKVTNIDQQMNPTAAASATGGQVKYWVTFTVTTPDATTKCGTAQKQFVVDYSAGTLPTVGDTVNIVVG